MSDPLATRYDALDGKAAVTWAFLMSSRDDLLAARDAILGYDEEFQGDRVAILDAAHRRRFGRPLPHA